MKKFLVLLITFLLGAVFFTNQVSAADQTVYERACNTRSASEQENHFTCRRDLSANPGADGNWVVDGPSYCGEGFEIDPGLCAGNGLSNPLCPGNNCCLPCVAVQTEEEKIPWGGSCPQTNRECENGTSCIGGRCLKPDGSIGLAAQCKANRECANAPNGRGETPSCQSDGGTTICRYSANDEEHCTTDSECIEEAVALGMAREDAEQYVSCDDQDHTCFDASGQVPNPDNEDDPLEWDLCKQAASKDREACNGCQTGGGVWTAIGCITHTPGGIVTQVMRVGLSMAGGIALLMILAAAFKFTVSKGDPKNIGEARELLQSAVIGLLFIIFSVTILQFIGVTIFQIPGFGS